MADSPPPFRFSFATEPEAKLLLRLAFLGFSMIQKSGEKALGMDSEHTDEQITLLADEIGKMFLVSKDPKELAQSVIRELNRYPEQLGSALDVADL